MLDMIRTGGDSYPRRAGIRPSDPEVAAVDSRLRLLSFACAVVLFAGVVATFTVDGDDSELASADSPTSTTAGDDVATGDSTSTSEPTDESSTTVADSSSTTEAPATTTTAAPTTTTPTTETIPARTPTAPGTYTYQVTGTAAGKPVNGPSTLTVSQVDAQGRQTHNQNGAEGESTTVYRHAPEGTYLESMTMSAQGQSFTLTATSPFLVIPSDVRAGTVTTGQLQGAGLTADVTFTALEIGPSTSRATIEADISGRVMNACNVDGTMTNTITARTQDQLPIDTRSVSDLNATPKGLICPGRITSDTRSVLQQ